MSDTAQGLSPVLSELNDLVEHLDGVRSRAASAFAAEMFFFANIAQLVQRRERERAARADDGARVDASQLAMREVYADIAAALQLSECQVASRVDQAHTLVNEFPDTLYEVSDGRLSPQHAQAIASTGIEIRDPAVRGEYERLALDLAAELTAAQLRAALGGLVNRLDPEGTQERIREAVTRRGVRVRMLEPGLSRLTLDAPTAEAEAVFHRLTDIATEIHADNAAVAAVQAAAVQAEVEAEGAVSPENAADDSSTADASAADDGPRSGFVTDERTRGQIMADVALDLLLTSAPEGHGDSAARQAELGAIQATVHITIPAATLTGAGTGGAEVTGVGAIDDDTARRLAGASDTWYRVFTDPTTGVPVSVDKRRPCTAQKRLLRARDETCRFPGCRRPARKSDIDHTVAVVDGGPTALWNLAHLCERHHTMKHHTDWAVEQLPGGVLRWVAPTRRIHTTRPPGTVRFIPDRPPGASHSRVPGPHHHAPDCDPASAPF